MPPRGAKRDVIVGVITHEGDSPYNRIICVGGEDDLSLAHYFDKCRTVKLCEVVIRHPSFAVKRLPTTTTTTTTARYRKSTGGDTIALRTYVRAYIRFNIVTNEHIHHE